MAKLTQGDVFQYGEQTFITIAVESNRLRALPLDAGVRIVHVGNHALPLRDFSRKLELPLMELPVIERRGFDGAKAFLDETTPPPQRESEASDPQENRGRRWEWQRDLEQTLAGCYSDATPRSKKKQRMRELYLAATPLAKEEIFQTIWREFGGKSQEAVRRDVNNAPANMKQDGLNPRWAK
jgi:hypothetical protein